MSFSDMFFPEKCPFCGKNTDKKERKPECCFACEECREELEIFPEGGKGRVKGLECVPEADKIFGLFAYRGQAKESVRKYKFGGQLWIGSKFGESFYLMLEENGVFEDVFFITYVPITEERFRERGFDQSRYICEILAEKSGRMLLPLIKRNYQGKRNSESNLEDRKGRGDKYSPEEKYIPYIKGKNLLLVDDILTTGATLSECTRVLKNAGAAKVYCAVLCSGRNDL